MDWYYALNHEQKGPVSQEELVEKLSMGELSKNTLVYCTGMTDWKRAETAFEELGIAMPGAGFIRQGEQKLETVSLGEGRSRKFVYGGFWIRFVSSFIDGLILHSVSFVFGFVLGLIAVINHPDVADPDTLLWMNIVIWIFSLVMPLAYLVFFMGRFGATLGMMALGLKIIVAGGGKVSYARATGRYLASILSAMILGIGYLMIAFDDKKRSLHDRICDTRIIKARESDY